MAITSRAAGAATTASGQPKGRHDRADEDSDEQEDGQGFGERGVQGSVLRDTGRGARPSHQTPHSAPLTNPSDLRRWRQNSPRSVSSAQIVLPSAVWRLPQRW